MKNIKRFSTFINEDNFYKDKYYQDYDKYPEDILSYHYPPKNDVRDLDGKKVWEKADQIGREALEEWKRQNPDDKYGGSSVLGSGIMVKQVEFPNPVLDLATAAFETFGMNRLYVDKYVETDEEGNIWYKIPNNISQGSMHQEAYAKPIVEYLKSLGFDVYYTYGRMD
jgi:hypothetical protein